MKKITVFGSVALVLCGVVLAADYPQWFVARGVIDAAQPANDYAPANQGQVKWVATQAYNELQQKLPSADLAKLLQVVDSFPAGGNHRPANLGMLKAVAAPFYDELIAAGYADGYPWAGGSPADYNIANQGQLKNLFAFDLDVDLDGEGLVDWWAQQNNVSGGDADADGDGASNAREYALGTDPNNADSDGDGVSDGDELARRTDPLVADSDGDGLSDGEEIAAGSNPLLVDTDGDGLGDFDEVRTHFTNPALRDTDGDGLPDMDEVFITLTDPNHVDTDMDGILDMELVVSLPGSGFLEYHNGHRTSFWTEEGLHDIYVSKLNGYVKNSYVLYEVDVATGGVFRITVDASWKQQMPAIEDCATMRFYIDGHLVQNVAVVAGEGESGSYSIYTPWLAVGRHQIKCNPLPVNNRNTAGLSIQKISLYTIDGRDLNGDGIQDWMKARMPSKKDSDKDGIPDWEEVQVRRTDPLNQDTDGDGLSDRDELNKHNTDPLNPDTDGDGVEDGIEVAHALTNPLTADFGGKSIVMFLNGSQTRSLSGEWVKEDSVISAVGVNGELEYVVDVPSASYYSVEFAVADRSVFKTGYDCKLTLAVDGIGSGKINKKMFPNKEETIQFFTPFLNPGEHRLQLKWDNVDVNHHLVVASVRLVAFDGVDEDGNGVPDWMDLRRENSLDLFGQQLTYSKVSPVCIEGYALYRDLLEIDCSFAPHGTTNQIVLLKRSVRDGWYANVKLSPYETTDIVVADTSTSCSLDFGIKWETTNLLDTPTNGAVIRVGDAMLFNAQMADQCEGAMLLSIEGPFGTTNCVGLSDTPVPFIFEAAGAYTVTTLFSTNTSAVHVIPMAPTNAYGWVAGTASEEVFANVNVVTSEVFKVHVVDARFNGDPTCYIGKVRDWPCPDIGIDVEVEHDDGLIVIRKADGDGSLIQLTISSEESRMVVARLGAAGPIADAASVWPLTEGFYDEYRVLEEFPDGGRLAEVTIALGNIPDDFRLVVAIRTGGVTFLDGSIQKTFAKDDFDDQGRLKYVMVQSPDVEAVCRWFSYYSGDALLFGKDLEE